MPSPRSGFHVQLSKFALNLQNMQFLGLKNPIFFKFYPRYARDFTFRPSLEKFLGAPMIIANFEIFWKAVSSPPPLPHFPRTLRKEDGPTFLVFYVIVGEGRGVLCKKNAPKNELSRFLKIIRFNRRFSNMIFFWTRLSSSWRPLGEKIQRSKNIGFLMLYNFCFDIFLSKCVILGSNCEKIKLCAPLQLQKYVWILG